MPSGHRPPIPPGVARVALSGTVQGHAWTNVFYCNLGGTGITSTDLSTLATDIGNAWNTNVATQVTSDVVLTQVAIVYVPSVGNEVNATVTMSHAGSAASTIIDNASGCFVVNMHISAYYRGGHPRLYMPGPRLADVSAGSIVNSSTATNVASAWNNVRTAINAVTTANISSCQMGTLSFQTANTWRNPPIFRPYTGVSVRGIIGTQRRRLTA